MLCILPLSTVTHISQPGCQGPAEPWTEWGETVPMQPCFQQQSRGEGHLPSLSGGLCFSGCQGNGHSLTHLCPQQQTAQQEPLQYSQSLACCGNASATSSPSVLHKALQARVVCKMGEALGYLFLKGHSLPSD